MKISIEVDCTPEEARRFLGLPDLSEANDRFAEAVAAKVASAMEALDPESIIKTWFPGGLGAVEQFQKAFWDQFGGAAKGGKSKE